MSYIEGKVSKKQKIYPEAQEELLDFMNKNISQDLKKSIDLAYKLSYKEQPQLKVTVTSDTSSNAWPK